LSKFLRWERKNQRKKSAILAFNAFIRGYFLRGSAKTGVKQRNIFQSGYPFHEQ